MGEVVRKSFPGDLNRRPISPKPKKAIVVRSATHDRDELTQLICKKIDSLGLRDVEMRPCRDGVVITSALKEAISSLQRELETNAATRRTVNVTQERKRFPQIKIAGISEDRRGTPGSSGHAKRPAEDFTLAKSWRGEEGKTACLEITKQALEAQRGRLNLKWTRCRFFDSTFVPRCKKCAQLGHETFCKKASRRTDCGGAHHLRQCKSRHESCRACERAFPGENREHSFLSYDCPVFRHAQSRRTTQLIAHLQSRCRRAPRCGATVYGHRDAPDICRVTVLRTQERMKALAAASGEAPAKTAQRVTADVPASSSSHLTNDEA
ncbi:hypothetical protein HPB52_000811 [Rhipicephalus sanguineus]|uniref:Gag-like protein n=1 Tax=Rhipicephalus sanguineus TaxID=34632 RepID=A0A9D4PTA5_RHISA|nr:hypothetical protein HPB52_000811 [Rhipicephalus sanguineus]